MRKILLTIGAVFLLFGTNSGKLIGLIDANKKPTYQGVDAYEVFNASGTVTLNDVIGMLSKVNSSDIIIIGGDVKTRAMKPVRRVTVTVEEVIEDVPIDLK